MLLKKVILENYGLYAGEVILDLAPRSARPMERPIILFGGKNGSGKTTLLEAVKLVLYGKNSLNSRASKAEYETYLRGKIHNHGHSVLPCNSARIAIEFDYVTLGENTTYFVERSWKVESENNRVKETLQILINDKPENNVTEEYWKGFIEGIIPERLSQLFFFDGEKIKNIADDEHGNKTLAESIKTLLGLDVVERLKADLTIFKKRELKSSSLENDKKKWAEIEREISRHEEEIYSCLSESLPSIRTKIEGKLTEIRNRETALHREGNLFATRRDALKTERNKLESEIQSLENTIRHECERNFPFSLCPTISKDLKQQLNTEKDLHRQAIVRDEIEAFRDEILEAARTIPALPNSTLIQIDDLITSLAGSRLEITDDKKNKIILGHTEATANTIEAALDAAEKESKILVRKVSQKLQKTTQKLRKIIIEIDKIPKDEQIRPIFEELAILNQEHGVLLQEEKQLVERVDRLKNSLRMHQKELEKLIERQQSQDRLLVVDKVNDVLNDYLQKLTVSKIAQLRKSVAQAFNSLSRKGDILERVEIDPDSFAVTLYDHDGNAIPKAHLSSGERQLYAVAMLWGLAKTSGRPLPVIIDTPLARLDSDHRMNLIRNYFPEASHQVILLSTDTEVDQQLFSELQPCISHCYHLKFNKKTKSTVVEEEYFWPEETPCPN